jgi:hypothetical protein
MKRKYIFIAIGLLFVVRIYCAYQRACVPFELDYEEGNVLNAGLRLLQHQTLYPAPGSFPYIVNPYGPVGYLVTSLGIRISGLSLLGPRLLVLFSGVLIVLLVVRLLRHFGVEGHIAWLFGLLYLCSATVWNWYPLLRVDFWAILLSLSGIYVFVAYPRFRYVSALLFAAALLTKPTALAAPTACVIELVIERRFRQLWGFVLLICTLIGVCVLRLGEGFRFSMLHSHPDPYSLTRLIRLYYAAIESAFFPFAIIGLALFVGFRCRPASRVIWIYAGAATLTALTAGKLGSETNHFLEWTAVVYILAGLALSYLFSIRNRLAVPLLIGSFVIAVLFSVLPEVKFVPGPNQGECSDAYRFVRSLSTDRILSEDVTALVLSGKPVLVSNPFVITELGHRIAWSRGPVDEMVKQKEFDLIFLGGETQNFDASSGRWSPEFIQNVGTLYRLKRRFRCEPNLVAAYVPREGTPFSASTPTSPSRQQSARP